MRNIAIFVSGEGEAAERIVTLFNEGNRVKTVLVIVDDSAVSLLQRLSNIDVKVVHIPDSDWNEKSSEIAQMLTQDNVKLIVLDKFSETLSDEILATTGGKIVEVTSKDLAPREVVAALESELRTPVKEVKEEPEDDKEPTPEMEWAKTFNIKFNPPQKTEKESESGKPSFTPPLPINSRINPSPSVHNLVEQPTPTPISNPDKTVQTPAEPMPPTWLLWSILVTIFCCFIPGIVAIIFSALVSSKYYSGDIETAKRYSRRAEIWIIVSFVLGVLSATLYVPLMLIGWL